MNISWQYLDKRSAIIAALKDYDSMQYIIDNFRDNEAYKNYEPAANTGNICRGTAVNINVNVQRYSQAQEFMLWFKPAWDVISADERFVLKTFYLSGDYKQIDNVYDICDRYNIERTFAYKKKDRALAHLATLLYGK